MAEPAVTLAVSDSIGTIALARPAKRNAVTYDMWVALGHACHAAGADPTVRVVVLRGEGEHFCAGADIGELAERPAHSPSFMDVNMVAEHALAGLPKPTVAFVQGDCIGGGCALAIDCDIRIAVEGSRFGITPSKLGIVYPPASLERVVRLIGPAARRLLYTGDLIDGHEALHLGLIDELLPADRAEQRLGELCGTLAQRSLLTQAATKEMIAAVLRHGAVPADLADAWAREVALADDPTEGVAAFAERRPPRFTWSGPNPTA